MLATLAARAVQLIGVSRFEADLFSKNMGIARDRFTIVPNGARLPVPSAAASTKKTGLIVSLGRLERYKGHHRALDAFARLAKTHPHMRLRLLGEGPYEGKLRLQIVALGLQDKVEIGSIPAGDRAGMADLLSSASLVVLLSDYEAHPVAVMEALSVNVPVLTTDTSGFQELVEQGLVCAVPLNANAEFVADRMLASMEAGPAARAMRLPDWDDCTDQLLAVYQKAVSGNQVEAYPAEALSRSTGS